MAHPRNGFSKKGTLTKKINKTWMTKIKWGEIGFSIRHFSIYRSKKEIRQYASFQQKGKLNARNSLFPYHWIHSDSISLLMLYVFNQENGWCRYNKSVLFIWVLQYEILYRWLFMNSGFKTCIDSIQIKVSYGILAIVWFIRSFRFLWSKAQRQFRLDVQK